MADASISMVLNRLAPIIEKKVREEVCLMLNANDEAEKLALKLKKIQDVLLDAEEQGVTDRKVKSWLDKLQDISYDIDEVLDLWDAEIQKRRLDELDDDDDSQSLLHKVSSFLQSLCLCFRQSIERRTMAKDIKKLNERLDVIAQENENEFKFIPNLSRVSQDFKRITSTSFVDVSEVQGRDGDLKLLMKKLLPPVKEDGIQIVSLIGMGGMGKTTLAQLAFNDNIVKDHFDVKIWVCVSHPFDQIKIAKAILEAVGGNFPNMSQLQELLQTIEHSILRKRFLLVLDDVWLDDATMWIPLKIALSKNGTGPGSRILVTTRKEKVAKIMGSTQMQLLNPLSDSYCWSILSKIAFHDRNEGDCHMLEEIGYKIALKCKGLPLAAKTLGSLLSFKSSLQEWENVLKSKVWEMDEVRTNIFPFLALSYNELHPAVKRCFSYCAIFPKDSDINVDELIRIWMAQGFLYSNGTSGDMELKGREYFQDLAMRSFFQDFGRDVVRVERITSCKMHDLVHDFALFLTKNECLIAENIQARVVKDVRHLNLLEFGENTTVDMISHLQLEKLCTFIFKQNRIPQILFKHLKRVKSLQLSYCELIDIPEEIGNLIHLRSLDLSLNHLLVKLPKSICDLYNLQTLDLRWCGYLSGLPHGINRLVNLRHLFVYGTSKKFEFTEGLEKLVNLRSLDFFGCGRGRGNKLGYLKDLNLIGGYLAIEIEDMDDGCDINANLKNKTFIEHLKVYCGREVGVRVIDALQPSPNLRGLNFYGSYLPNWISTLINLRELEIGGRGKDMDVLHSLRNFPFLEHLNLNELEIAHLSVEFFGLQSRTEAAISFPNLLTLRLIRCHRLREWEDIGEDENIIILSSVLPRLNRLEIKHCWKLRALPHRLLRKAALPLQILDIGGCPYLRERYDKEQGQDRDEIKHIPIVRR
ncbi:putative disease resistance protein RGA4 [Henckelia pumila]|uniref:putative disease resistance protein RGA4 n=1 Tax=Henckelia pumila TaxID=405737 RepID=UPI003C6E1F5C